MGDDFTPQLIWEAVAVGTVALLLAACDLPLIVASLITLVRFGIPTFYFGAFLHDGWRLLDDQTYFEQGVELLHSGLTPLTALLPDGYESMQLLAGGPHVLYLWWNLLAIHLFGENYYAPVLLNVLVTFGTAAVLRRTAALAGFSRGYCQGLQIFYLLHWEAISWSSFLNLKDCIVQLLSAIMLFSVVRFYVRKDLLSILLFLGMLPLFYWIRFYVPIFILGVAGLWVLLQWKGLAKFVICAVLAGLLYHLLPQVAGRGSEVLDLEQIIFGTCHMLVTPLPWSLIDGYSFLTLSCWMHLLLLLPACYAMISLAVSRPLSRLYVIYFLVLVGFYAATEELWGPRHRFQLAFILAWFQFHFLWECFAKTVPQTTAPCAGSAPQFSGRAAAPAGAWS